MPSYSAGTSATATSEGRRGVFNLHVFNDRRYPEDNARLQALMSSVKPGG